MLESSSLNVFASSVWLSVLSLTSHAYAIRMYILFGFVLFVWLCLVLFPHRFFVFLICLFVCLLNPLYVLCLLSDVDECLRSPCEQICNNNPGGYKCGCRKGYNKHRSNEHRCTGIKCANNIFLFAYIVTRASDNS